MNALQAWVGVLVDAAVVGVEEDGWWEGEGGGWRGRGEGGGWREREKEYGEWLSVGGGRVNETDTDNLPSSSDCDSVMVGMRANEWNALAERGRWRYMSLLLQVAGAAEALLHLLSTLTRLACEPFGTLVGDVRQVAVTSAQL